MGKTELSSAVFVEVSISNSSNKYSAFKKLHLKEIKEIKEIIKGVYLVRLLQK